MKIAFCGHASYTGNEKDERRVLTLLEHITGNAPAEFFLGEHGGFDRFAYACAKRFKHHHPNAQLIWITAYYPPRQGHLQHTEYDLVLYPPLEYVPPRYAISHRNRWLVEQADVIIACVTNSFGGAHEMYQYAKRNKKTIYNIASASAVDSSID